MSLGKMTLAGLLLLAAIPSLWSQESQKEIQDRWVGRSADMSREFQAKDVKFGSSDFQGKAFSSSKADLQKSFNAQAFETKSFADKKTPREVEAQFKTDTAAIQDAKFSTQKAASTDRAYSSTGYSQQSKTLSGTDRSVSTRKADSEGKTDGVWKAFKEKLDKDLTMDEVRELLNKNK